MGRDPRKSSAFDSGMRGREKPKISDSHGGTMGQQDKGSSGGESKQGAGSQVGTPDGVDLSAYTSGMRGPEKPKQKPAASGATYGQEHEGAGGGESKQGPDTRVGHPDGHNDAGMGKRAGIDSGALQAHAANAHTQGIDGNNTEDAASHAAPLGQPGILGEEDDTHINIRIPKASLKRKAGGVHGS